MDGFNNGGAAQIPQKVKLSAKEFAAKFSTKRECFTFLTIDCKAYLPDYDTLTIYFLKDLIAGKKKCKCSFDIKTNFLLYQSSGRTSASTSRSRSTSR